VFWERFVVEVVLTDARREDVEELDELEGGDNEFVSFRLAALKDDFDSGSWPWALNCCCC